MLVGTAVSQEVDLNQYLEIVKISPGTSIAQKVEHLRGLGITLSRRGQLELETATKLNAASPSWSGTQWTPTPRPPAFAANPVYEAPLPIIDPSTSGTSQRIGKTTYHNFDSGVSGTSQQIGKFAYHDFSDGLSGTTQSIGRRTYTNWNDGTNATTQGIGKFQYHDLGDGVTGTSQTIGKTTYTNFSNGKNCTSNKIGSQVYTNCY